MRRGPLELLFATLMAAVASLSCGCDSNTDDTRERMLNANDSDVQRILASHMKTTGDNGWSLLDVSSMKRIPDDSSTLPKL